MYNLLPVKHRHAYTGELFPGKAVVFKAGLLRFPFVSLENDNG